MRNQFVRTAVLAALGSVAAVPAAMAASHTLHISGASAQRTFWENDLEAIATGTFGSVTDAGGATVCFLTKTSPTLNPAVPDIHGLVCTISANRGGTTVSLPTGIAAGDVITLYYEAEYGSVWGIAPFLDSATTVSHVASNASTKGRHVIQLIAGGGTQTITGYNRDLDTATAGLGGTLPVDIGVTDMEPVLWANPDNWPLSDGIGGKDGTGTNQVINILSIPGQGAPTLTDLQNLQNNISANNNWQEVNGQVFTVITEATTVPTKNVTNLSTDSLRGIFTGKYKTWKQVPEVGLADTATSGTNIVVCRRDHGSGTQVSASLYFTATECGGNNGTNSSGAGVGGATRFVSQNTSALGGATGSLATVTYQGVAGNPVENYSSNDVNACLAAFPGQAIGIRSLSLNNAAYNTITIDGVPPNAHNAASGAYKYAFTTWANNNTANTQPGDTAVQALATQLIADAQLPANGALPKESGSLVAGTNIWTTTAPQVAYAIQDGINTIGTIAGGLAARNNAVVSPIAVWSNTAQASCFMPF